MQTPKKGMRSAQNPGYSSHPSYPAIQPLNHTAHPIDNSTQILLDADFIPKSPMKRV